MKENFVDSFSLDLPADTSWRVDEGKEDSVVDGVSILARAVGPFFLVEGASRNGRYYSKSLWENAIKRSEGTFASGTMLGTIGHDTELDDNALLEGKASHRVNKLWIDEAKGIGMGEILVLNTPAGRNLNGYLRGGVQFPVSSRATGEYTGKKVEGANEIDADTFMLERFDFVRVPGVEKAVPRLVESSDDNDNPVEDKLGDNPMSQELVEKLTKEKIEMQEQLDDVLASNKDLEGKGAVLTAKVEELTAQIAEVDAKLATANEALEAAETAVKAFEAIGDADSVAKSLEDAKAIEEGLAPLGSVESVAKVFEYLKPLTEADITVEAGVAVALACEGMDAEEVAAKFEMLAKYEALGSADRMEEALDAIIADAEQRKVEEAQAEIDKLAEETGVEATMAEKLLGTMDFEEAKGFVESVSGKKLEESAADEDEDDIDESARFEKSEDKGGSKKLDESKGKDLPNAISGSRSSRLFEGMVRD